MNLSGLKNLTRRTQFSILAVAVLAIGTFVTVRGAQQSQENRSHAAGIGGTGNCATVNATTEDLHSDNCTVQSGFNHSIFGSSNVIRGGLGGNITGDNNIIHGGMNGSIMGDGNDICGGLGGGITGNNNIIHGGINGPIKGTGNIIHPGTSCPDTSLATNPTVSSGPTQVPNQCRTEFAVFRPSTGQWLIKDGPAVNWGTSGDIPVQGDYNGDGRTEFAVFRPSTGQWLIKDGPAVNWGTSGDIPVQGDYTCASPTIPTNSTPTPTPYSSRTLPNSTCNDAIDNNHNNLVDEDDPACHADGDPNNPYSYDPGMNEGNITTTQTPTPTVPTSTCSDNIDNDNNGFKDNQDSTCHTDNNPQNPNSYDPSAPGEQGGGNTCADSRDNNNNGLIDGADPICHTDEDQNNPNSYDPNKVEVGAGVTPTVGPTSTPAPTTSAPTSTPVPTTPVNSGDTTFTLTLLLHGIGHAGDSANPGSGGNTNPLHTQRDISVEVYDSSSNLVSSKAGSIDFQSGPGNFTGTVNMGNTLTTGVYTVKLKSTQFLRAIVPGIQSITAGQSKQLPVTTLVNGDINSDNTINILDYNILMGCYSDFLPATSCTDANKLLADLDDDGAVNQFDYNLFLRELANRQGQ